MLLGKYRVDEIVGRGGMGLVVKACHLGLGEQVAIKMLRDDVALADETVARFVREAQAAAKLKGEHIARITDVGTFDDGKPYMVMEYLEGQDIGQLLTERGRMQPSLAIDLVIQACEALAEAHSLDIVHRDIKPTNLFLTSRPDGSVLLKILDFGISKAPQGPELYLTQTWSLLGTPAYMSPEQMRSAHDVDARTDIWSLGAVLYEALEGHVPFEADSFSEMCVMVAVDPPAPMTATPRDLVPVIMRCLAKATDQRYPNVALLARDLARLAREPESALILVDRIMRMLDRGASRRTPVIDVPNTVDLAHGLGVPPSEAFPSVETTLPHRPDATPSHGVARSTGTLPAQRPSAIGIPLGPIASSANPLSLGAQRPASGPIPLGAQRPRTGPMATVQRPDTGPVAPLPPQRGTGSMAAVPQRPSSSLIPVPAANASPAAEPYPSYPSIPSYQTRVPLPVPLHDDALFPRPGLQLPRGAPARAPSPATSMRASRGWLVVAITATAALAAVVAVVLLTRTSPVPAPRGPDGNAGDPAVSPTVTPIAPIVTPIQTDESVMPSLPGTVTGVNARSPNAAVGPSHAPAAQPAATADSRGAVPAATPTPAPHGSGTRGSPAPATRRPSTAVRPAPPRSTPPTRAAVSPNSRSAATASTLPISGSISAPPGTPPATSAATGALAPTALPPAQPAPSSAGSGASPSAAPPSTSSGQPASPGSAPAQPPPSSAAASAVPTAPESSAP